MILVIKVFFKYSLLKIAKVQRIEKSISKLIIALKEFRPYIYLNQYQIVNKDEIRREKKQAPDRQKLLNGFYR